MSNQKAISVRNLDKYQDGYKDRRHHWAKVYIDMVVGNPECEMLDEIDWARLVKLIVLQATMRRPVPLHDLYLQKRGFDLRARSVDETMQNLAHFVEIVDVTENKQNRNESVTKTSPREEKRRVEGRTVTNNTRLEKPSLNDLKEAFTAKGFASSEAEREARKFLGHYESVGWVVGRARSPMKSWRGAVASWVERRPDFAGKGEPKRDRADQKFPADRYRPGANSEGQP